MSDNAALQQLIDNPDVTDFTSTVKSKQDGKNHTYIYTFSCKYKGEFITTSSENLVKSVAKTDALRDLFNKVSSYPLGQDSPYSAVLCVVANHCKGCPIQFQENQEFQEFLAEYREIETKVPYVALYFNYILALRMSGLGIELIPKDGATAGYSETIKKLWNKLMHALNGNGKNGKNEVVVKVENGQGKSKSSAKKARRKLNKAAKAVEELALLKKVQMKKGKKSVKGKIGKATSDVAPAIKNEVFKAIYSIAAPGVNTPPRFGSSYTTGKTAVASPWSREPADWATDAATNNYLDKDRMFACLFRDPVRHKIIYLANSAGLTSTYYCQFINVNSPQVSTFYSDPIPPERWYPNISHLRPASTAPYKPHGNILGVGITKDFNKGAFFMKTGDQISLNINLSAYVGATLLVYEEIWDGDQWNNVTNSNVGGTFPATFTATETGYHRFSFAVYQSGQIIGSDTENWSFSMNVIQTGSIFAHKMIKDLDLKLGSIDSIRITGLSLMYSSRAPELYVNGSSYGVQVSGGQEWTDFIDGTKQISEIQASIEIPSKKGMYGFIKPTQFEDFDLIHFSDIDGSLTKKVYFSIDEVKSYLVFDLSIEEEQGRNGFWTDMCSVEYETTDTWLPVDSASISNEVYQQALQSVKSIPAFHENPLHLRDVFQAAKSIATRIGSAVVKYGPTAISLAKTALPMIAAL